MNEFVPITCPAGSQDAKLFTAVVNQGIDSHLQAFTKSKFKHGNGDYGEPRLILDFHVSELPLLVRRLHELETEEAEQWANDIEELEEYPK